jgi:starch synthase
MNILLIAAQFAPYVAQRPSAESVAQLAKALRLLEHTVTVLLPKTDDYQAAGLILARRLSPLVAPSRESNDPVEVAHVYDVTLTNGVRLGLLDLLGRSPPESLEPSDAASRATWLSQWAQAVGAYVTAQIAQGTPFDVVHAHDCEIGLALLSVKEGGLPKVLSVHDADETGSFPREMAGIFGLTEEWLSSHDVGSGEEISLLKGLLSQADAVIVPSESYGKKLQAPEHRGGLARAFQAADVIGIVEGVDQAVFNPATDSTLSCRYDAARWESKGRNRAAVLDRLGLSFDPARPIVFCEWDAMGDCAWSTLLGALPSLLRNEMALVVAGGPAPSGEITEAFTDQFRYVPGLEPAQRRGLLAASDFYLSVARKDPTGRRLMQASRYGSVPIAYLTDAVADVLVDCDGELATGTGIVFESMTQRALQTALARALRAYNRPNFHSMVARVMRRDLAWDRAARRHAQVYSQLAHGA